MEYIVYPYESVEQVIESIDADSKINAGDVSTVRPPRHMTSQLLGLYVKSERPECPMLIGLTLDGSSAQQITLDTVHLTPEQFHTLAGLDVFIEDPRENSEPEGKTYTVYDLLDLGACRNRVGALGRHTGKYAWSKEELLDFALNEGGDDDVSWIRETLENDQDQENIDPVYGILSKYFIPTEEYTRLKENFASDLYPDTVHGCNILVPYKEEDVPSQQILDVVSRMCKIISSLKSLDNS